jgi:5'-nucleotidase (lipoprotein e(P4) family)
MNYIKFKKMKQFFLSLLLLGVLMVSCTERHSGSAGAKRDEEVVMPILYQQRAAKYRALCFQAYNIARRKIDATVGNRNYRGKPIAIITDLDETALDNSASEAWLYMHDSAVNMAFLTDWWLKGIADSVPGAFLLSNMRLVRRSISIIFPTALRRIRSSGPR